LIKILHTADIHLDAPLRSLALRDAALRDTIRAATRTAFEGLVDRALEEGVAALLIAGDLFDGKERSARTGAFLLAQLERLRTAGIRVFYVKGNHDAENPITGALELPDNCHVFGARGGKVALGDEVWIHGVSFADRHAPESLLPRFAPPVPGAVNIALLHSSLAGAQGHDVYAPCSVAELAGMGFDYWALGHVHKRAVHAQEPWIVMPGIPQGRDIGEAGPKSATLLTIAQGGIAIEEVPTAIVEFVPASLDVTPAQTDDALRALLRERLAELRAAVAAREAVVRLTLTGTPVRAWQILRDRDVWREQAAEMARAAGGLWLDKLHFEIAAPEDPGGTAASAETASATDALAALMADLVDDPGLAAAAQAEVETVLQDLPAALRDRLMPDADARDALASRLARAGAARVVARMKGADG
jgi:DNA repair exonuclease SbcCD nuclease subunit